MASQKDQILDLLKSGEWVCSTNFYALYIADPRRRLCDLKADGYDLRSRWCERHEHKGQMKEWLLVEKKVIYDILSSSGKVEKRVAFKL